MTDHSADAVRWEYAYFEPYGNSVRDVRELDHSAQDGWEPLFMVTPRFMLLRRLIDGSVSAE